MQTRAAMLLFLLASAACGPQQQVSKCSPSATAVAKPPVPVVFAGEALEVEVVLPPAVFCQGGNPVATSVTTEVVDALNQPVTHERGPPTSSDTRGYATTVRFTPLRRGVYLVTARFEPSLGVVQRLVQVVSDRSTARPTLRVPVVGACDDVVAFARHALCRRGGVVSVVGADGGVAQEGARGIAAAGRVGWFWGDAGVTRLLELDGGLISTTTAVALGDGAATASQDTLLVAHEGGFTEVLAQQAGLVVREWPAHDAGVVGGLARAGDVVGFATPSRLCALGVDGGVHCVEHTLVAGAGEGGALWLRGAETQTVALARFSSAVQEPAVMFLAGQSTALEDVGTPRPAFTWNGRLVTVRADDLSLEAWLAPGPAPRRWVTPEHVVFQLAGELVIYTR